MPTSSDRGAPTRERIRVAAFTLFAQHPLPAVTVGEVARAAGVYPNQITHHFGSKDGLFVDVAFTRLLRDTARLQASGRSARRPDGFRETLARTALILPSVEMVVRALSVARENADVRTTVRGRLDLLFRQSERYLARVLAERGWELDGDPAQTVRTFWSAVFGALLVFGTGFPGDSGDLALAATIPVR